MRTVTTSRVMSKLGVAYIAKFQGVGVAYITEQEAKMLMLGTEMVGGESGGAWMVYFQGIGAALLSNEQAESLCAGSAELDRRKTFQGILDRIFARNNQPKEAA